MGEFKIPNINFNNFSVSAELCRRSYHEFVKEFWHIIEGSEFTDNWHIKFLADQLQIVAERVINRLPKLYDLSINMPPGMTKSTLTSKMLLPWIWTRNKSVRFLVAAHNVGLSEKFNIKAKMVINSPKYEAYFGKVIMNPKLDRNQHFRNIYNGECVCAGITGEILGQHYDIHVYDDLIKPKQAHSDSCLNDMRVFVTEVASGRKTNRKTTPVISVCQRLSALDQTSVMQDYFTNVKEIILPMDIVEYEPEPEYLKKYYIDGLLQPSRFDWDNVADEKKKGKYHYPTQYGQQPARASGEIWKDDFNWIDDSQLPRTSLLADYGTDWDFAYTKKTINSASAYVTSGKLGDKIFIYDMDFFWKETPAIKSFMRAMKNPGVHYIENKANGKAIHDDLLLEGCPVHLVSDIPNSGDSVARASLASMHAEKVYIAQSLKYKLLHSKRQGILKFPNNANDDLSDAFAQAILRHKQMYSALW